MYARQVSYLCNIFAIILHVFLITKVPLATSRSLSDMKMVTKTDTKLVTRSEGVTNTAKPLHEISKDIGQQLAPSSYVFNYSFCTCIRVDSDMCVTAVSDLEVEEATVTQIKENYSRMLCVRIPCLKYTCDLTGSFLCRRKTTQVFEFEGATVSGKKPLPCKKVFAEREFYYSDISEAKSSTIAV